MPLYKYHWENIQIVRIYGGVCIDHGALAVQIHRSTIRIHNSKLSLHNHNIVFLIKPRRGTNQTNFFNHGSLRIHLEIVVLA